MKFFLTQQNYRKYFQINNAVTGLLLIVLALSVMPLYADYKYRFPSDVVDQSEQAVYDADRESRYANRRVWAYPEESRIDEWKKKQQNQYPDNEYYNTIDRQPSSYDARPYFNAHSNSDSSGNTQSGRYNYNGDSSNQFQNYRPVDKFSGQAPAYRLQNYSNPTSKQDSMKVQPYPEERFGTHFDNNVSEQSMPMEHLTYPVNRVQRYRQRYPNVMYPGDVESESRSSRQEEEVRTYKPQKQIEQEQKNVQIRYIPVPVYSVPGSLPGTVPGVVTPGNMVPGYSHLSPNYTNYGGFGHQYSPFGAQYRPFGSQYSPFGHQYSPFGSQYSPFGHQYSPLGSQYAPLTGFGSFPGAGNPFGNVLNYNGNNSLNDWPFMTPDFSQ